MIILKEFADASNLKLNEYEKTKESDNLDNKSELNIAQEYKY